MATGGVAVQGTGQFGAMPQPGQGAFGPGPMPPTLNPPALNQGAPGYPSQPPPQVFASQSYPSLGSGQYSMGSNPQLPGPQGMMMQADPSMSGGYGSMTPQGALQQPAGGAPDFLAKIKTHATPKVIAGVLFIIAGVIYLFDDDPRPKKSVAVVVDAGPATNGAAGSAAPPATAPPVMAPVTAPVALAWPPGVPCPPPNWPPTTPLPCTPNNVTVAPPERPANGKGAGREPKDAGAALPPGTKTLERLAVDFVAAGESARAAAAYEELVRRDPNNKVYGEAARILHAKLDGGAP
jgi:hypothetical protein